MEVNKPTENKTEFAKNFCKLVEQHQVNDGDPITIGSALKELPKQAISHDRIYDVIDVHTSSNYYKASGFEATVRHNAAMHVKNPGYDQNSVFAGMTMDRHNGEVTRSASANKRILRSGAPDDVVAECLNVPFYNGINLLTEDNDPSDDQDMFFSHQQNGGRKYKFVLEPVYPVDSDVIEDL